MTPSLEFLYRIAERFGLPVVILAVVMWWARTDIVQPLLDAHFSFIEKLAQGQEKHTEQLESVGRKLDEIIRISSQR